MANLVLATNRPSRRGWLVLYAASLILIVSGLIFGFRLIPKFFSAGIKIPAVGQTGAGSNAEDPVEISIPAIKVDASMEQLGLNSDQTLAVPKDPWNVGWFTGSSKPGENGPSVMVGHLDSTKGIAVFWNLHKLKSGDEILIQRADGQTIKYKVTGLQNFDQNNFPTMQVYGQTSNPTLRLITCSGTYSRSMGHYSQNLVVFADVEK